MTSMMRMKMILEGGLIFQYQADYTRRLMTSQKKTDMMFL